MKIGKSGPALSALCHAEADRIEIRGRDLTGDIMGHETFSGYFHFLLTGETPSDDQRYFLDLLLVAIAEHGLTPTAIAARMTYEADPDSLQAALAAGILGCGTVILGTSDLCGRLLVMTQSRIDAGASIDEAALSMATEIQRRGDRLPGFGHPIHRPEDPRVTRIFALADQRGVSGPYIALARAFTPAVEKAWRRPLPMNVSMAIAACLLDLDFPAAMIKAIPLLARTAGLLAHLKEEGERPIGFQMAGIAEEAIGYDGGED